jgi:hypothetical protein
MKPEKLAKFSEKLLKQHGGAKEKYKSILKRQELNCFR